MLLSACLNRVNLLPNGTCATSRVLVNIREMLLSCCSDSVVNTCSVPFVIVQVGLFDVYFLATLLLILYSSYIRSAVRCVRRMITGWLRWVSVP